MSANQFTPGPWAAELANKGNKNGHQFWHVVEDRPRPHRDSVVQLLWQGGIRESDEANARLIASAPALLAALQDSLYVGSDELVKLAIREKSRAAIARATQPEESAR